VFLNAQEQSRLSAFEQVITGYDPSDEERYQFPGEFFNKLHDAGLLAAAVPARYGGSNASLTLVARMLESAASVSPTVGWLLLSQYGLQLLLPTLAGEDCERYLSTVATQGALLSGSANTRSLSGTRRDDVVTISGVIRYCSGAPSSHWISVPVSIHDQQTGAEQAHCAMIRSNLPGVHCDPADYLHSLRGSQTGLVRLDSVQVPADCIYPFRHSHDRAALPTGCRYFGTWQSLLLQNAVFLGTAAGAVQVFLAMSTPRSAARTDRESLTSETFGAALTDLMVARTVFFERVAAVQRAADRGMEVEEAESAWTTTALSEVVARSYSCVSRLTELLAGSILMGTNDFERYWRDIQLARAAENTRGRLAAVNLAEAAQRDATAGRTAPPSRPPRTTT
jgi:alkylation response protein AidB-like acyl-CoA dehydrogenase